MGLPPQLTAATGMDALSHCIETFLAPAFNPPADGIGLDGLERGWRYIAQATHEPGNREARLNMMSASMQGAMAFQKGLGCVHSLSHSLGGLNPRLHHGIPDAVRDMNKHLGLPGGLGEVGIVPSLFPRIIEGALKDHTHKTNPREASALDYQAMLDRSL
jgi:4-hydroxybutyrate dehydrogenase